MAKKYEYKIEEVRSENHLNGLGSEGWLLVCIDKGFHIFSREIKKTTDNWTPKEMYKTINIPTGDPPF